MAPFSFSFLAVCLWKRGFLVGDFFFSLSIVVREGEANGRSAETADIVV